MGEAIVQSETIGAEESSQKTGAEWQGGQQVRERSERGTTHRDGLVVLSHDFDPECHFPDRLPSNRCKRDEIPAIQQKKKRGQRQQRQLIDLCAGQPGSEIQHDGIYGDQQRGIDEPGPDAADQSGR